MQNNHRQTSLMHGPQAPNTGHANHHQVAPLRSGMQMEVQIGVFGGLGVGLRAPLDSLRFLLGNKTTLLLGLAPQLIGLAGFIALATKPAAFLTSMVNGWFPAAWQGGALEVASSIVVTLLLMALYTVVWVPIVGVVASPVYDVVARRAFTAAAGCPLPSQPLSAVISNALGEAAKLLAYFFLLALAVVIPLLSPVFIVFSVWYLGWDIVDRTLAQTALTLRDRVRWGLGNPLACMGLGIWAFVPLVGALLGFAFAAAGGIVAARVGLIQKESPSHPSKSRPKTLDSHPGTGAD